MKPKQLTTLEAANIGRAMGVRGLIVHRDPLDRALWQVVTPGRVESHEPMDETTWREFIAGWIDRPARYDAGNGCKVTVPENDEQDLFDAIREQLSPHAVAAIAKRLSFNNSSFTDNDDVDRQVRWFTEQLVELLGGVNERDRLAKEIGL
jgi:hypothetical protein